MFVFGNVKGITSRVLAPLDDFSSGGGLNTVHDDDFLDEEGLKLNDTGGNNNDDIIAPENIILADNLSDAQKTFIEANKDKAIVTFSKDGDALDANGKVIIKASEITLENNDTDEYEAGTEIVVGEDTYTIDENGNLIDKDGNIFKEKKDVKSYIDSINTNDNDNDDSIIGSVIKAVGVEIKDAKGNPVQYSDDLLGISNYFKDAVEAKFKDLEETTEVNLFRRFPVLKNAYDYLVVNNGSLEGFNNVTDYARITVDDNNVEQHVSIIKEYYNQKGIKESDASDFIAMFKDKGILLNKAKEYLGILKEDQKQHNTQLKEQREQVEAQTRENARRNWETIVNTVNSGTVVGYVIPEVISRNVDGKKVSATKQDFLDYISKNVTDDETQCDIDYAKIPVQQRREQILLQNYLQFTGNDYSSLVNMAFNKKEIDRLKDLKNKSKGNTKIVIKRPASNNNDII